MPNVFAHAHLGADIQVPDGLLSADVRRMLDLVRDNLGQRLTELLALRQERRSLLVQGKLERLVAAEPSRSAGWAVDPLPAALLDRRVELLGGTRRNDLVNGLNSGAGSYIADLWNLTGSDAWDILRGHRNLIRTAHGKVTAINNGTGRTRVRPDSTTRLIVVPRPFSVCANGTGDPHGPEAAFFDVVVHACHNSAALLARQRSVLFVLRDVQGGAEAGIHAELFDLLERQLGLAKGSFRATVMVDSVHGALAAEEILHELRHHSYGLAIDPQAYAADHISLFSGADLPSFPDREKIGLNAPFLRSLSLMVIGIAHRRGAHALGAPAFVLPPDEKGRLKPGYLEMLADKEREAVDGHDGTIVGHPGLVTAALTEFNKSMPTAHQMGYQRSDAPTAEDLLRRPEGPITIESLVDLVRTLLLAFGDANPGEGVSHGGRIHDRSSIQLALALLWQWVHSTKSNITASGLDIQADLLRYLIKKEADKFMARSPAYRVSGRNAGERLLHLVVDDAFPVVGSY